MHNILVVGDQSYVSPKFDGLAFDSVLIDPLGLVRDPSPVSPA
jgi:hypothetical protein